MRARRRGVEISLHSKRFRASSSRKLGREQKKWNEGGGERERRKQRFPFSPPPPPPPSIFFFCSRSNFGAITRLGTLATQAMSKWEGGGEEGRGRDLGRGVSLLLFFYSFPFPFLRLVPRLADIIRLILISNNQCCYSLLDLMLIFLPDIINLHLIYRYPTFIVVSALSDITRNLRDDDGHVNEDVEKAIGLLSKIATQRACPTGTPFLYISFQSPHNCFTGRFMEDINAHKLKFGTQRIPGKNLPTFDISCKQFKIIATDFQKTRWLFTSDVFAVVAAVVAKAPNHQNCERQKNFRNIYCVWTRQERSGYAMCFRSFLQKRKTIKYASRRSVFESFSPAYS